MFGMKYGNADSMFLNLKGYLTKRITFENAQSMANLSYILLNQGVKLF